ncbi:hypothetical protein JOJ86_001384 [Rhodococcus percolatus]|nr:hypothetical protein [Rhodococcus opacus]MBA8958093.1 hypothetical protein [Rhodococcus opacus]MBP2203658.1 hypothetical protein [Rhodococcus opacus]
MTDADEGILQEYGTAAHELELSMTGGLSAEDVNELDQVLHTM